MSSHDRMKKRRRQTRVVVEDEAQEEGLYSKFNCCLYAKTCLLKVFLENICLGFEKQRTKFVLTTKYSIAMKVMSLSF